MGIDRPLHRWTGGRLTAPGLLAGLPVIMVTTTGARSGLARTMPLAGIPVADDLAVVGSNFAQARTPAWVQLAELYRRTGREPAADSLLRSGLRENPAAADLHYALGLSLARQRRLAEAVLELGSAARLAPGVRPAGQPSPRVPRWCRSGWSR